MLNQGKKNEAEEVLMLRLPTDASSLDAQYRYSLRVSIPSRHIVPKVSLHEILILANDMPRFPAWVHARLPQSN